MKKINGEKVIDKVAVPRVIVSRPMLGLAGMQVCCVLDATDEEILLVCNTENPSGTTGGWSKVVRKRTKTTAGPVPCNANKDRVHIIVLC